MISRIQLISVALLSITLIGCKGIKPEELRQPAKDSVAKLVVIDERDHLQVDGEDATAVNYTLLKEACSAPVSLLGVDPTTLAIASTTAKYLFDRGQQKQVDDLAAIKKGMTASYSARTILTASDLKETDCLGIVRHTEGVITTNSLVALIKLRHLPLDPEPDKEGFIFIPVMVYATDAAVFTLPEEEKDGEVTPSKLTASIGLSVKALGAANGVPVVADVGTAAVSVKDVQLPSTPAKDVAPSSIPVNACSEAKPCEKSELIPHVSDGDKLISLTMSVTETGQLGIDFDKREAEINAIKEAYGPVIKSAITERFGED